MNVEEAREMVERRAQAQSSVGDGLVVIPLEQLASMYERFLRLNRLGQATVDEWVDMPEAVKAVKHAVFEQSDFGALYAGQFLPKAVRDEVREKVRTLTKSET